MLLSVMSLWSPFTDRGMRRFDIRESGYRETTVSPRVVIQSYTLLATTTTRFPSAVTNSSSRWETSGVITCLLGSLLTARA